LNSGRTTSPVCAYLRELAGWCPTVVDLNQAQTLEARHGEYGTVLKYRTSRPTEYFIVENRSKLDLDAHLPASGLAVYHCDTRGSNEWQEGSSTRHYQCALLQADGHLDLEHNANQGDGGDLYGAVAGTILSHATRPASVRWDGAESGLVVSKVGPPGRVIQFTTGAVEPGPAPAQTIRGEAAPALAIPDQNPAGVSSVITLSQGGTVRRLKVSLNITHSYIGDLRVELVSPAGRRVLLHGQLGGSQDNLIVTYDSAMSGSPLAALIGQEARGAWLLRVADVVRLDKGMLNQWSVEITT
jgi:subtilisin-like proprotein convertase family protein